MAFYKSNTYLTHANDGTFDQVHSPGVLAPESGIYRCVTCGDEISHNAGVSLPSQNHRQHTVAGPIRWQMIVKAKTK